MTLTTTISTSGASLLSDTLAQAVSKALSDSLPAIIAALGGNPRYSYVGEAFTIILFYGVVCLSTQLDGLICLSTSSSSSRQLRNILEGLGSIITQLFGRMQQPLVSGTG